MKIPFFSSFDHTKAQKYELKANSEYIRDHFDRMYEQYTAHKDQTYDEFVSYLEKDEFFVDSKKAASIVADHVKGKACLEIGPGPYAELLHWNLAGKRIIVDPLQDEYVKVSKQLFGKTWYTDDIEQYSQGAELFLSQYSRSIDGVIICRNALDHCADWKKVLYNIGQYAVKGCYLLLWTDLWHIHGTDDGHRNLVKSPETFRHMIEAMGFYIEWTFDDLRKNQATIDFGCRARKR